MITAAALIMIAVFGGFVFDEDPRVKMFGLGLATAILVDATIIRLVLVPAIMKLLGDANWWLPRWLGRVLPERAARPVAAPREGKMPPPGIEPGTFGLRVRCSAS